MWLVQRIATLSSAHGCKEASIELSHARAHEFTCPEGHSARHKYHYVADVFDTSLEVAISDFYEKLDNIVKAALEAEFVENLAHELDAAVVASAIVSVLGDLICLIERVLLIGDVKIVLHVFWRHAEILGSVRTEWAQTRCRLL